jgi:hypothetical protein
MAIILSGTVWNGKYKITNLEDVDYIVVCILGSQDNSTKRDPPIYVCKLYKLCIYHKEVNTSDSHVVLLTQFFLSLSLSHVQPACERKPGEVTYLCVYYTIMAAVGEFR